MHDRDYGALGRIGIVTPQANPTVEPEIGLLLPDRVSMVVARCVSAGEPRQRFLDYFAQLGDTLARFDTMPLDAAGFACTASTYLVGHKAEARAIQSLQDRLGYAVVTAAEAIEAALLHLGAERIAIACPYPAWLLERAVRYWRDRGFDIVAHTSVQPDTVDTRSIYTLRAEPAGKRVREAFEGATPDAWLITGTGMPALGLLADLTRETGKPALNSNLCLAWRCLERAGAPLNERAPAGAFPLLGGWAEKLGRL